MTNRFDHEDCDPLLSPGYYQPSSAMTHGPGYNTHKPSVILETIKEKTVLYTLKGYIRKRWWGVIQFTREKALASTWKSSKSAVNWAEKNDYLVIM